jgi:hypothetical protein
VTHHVQASKSLQMNEKMLAAFEGKTKQKSL